MVGPGEMLIEIRLPVRPGGGSAYLKVARRVGDWPVGAAGAAVWVDGDTITDAGIGLTAVGARNFAAAEAEEFLRGAPATEETYASAGEIARRAAGRCPTSAGRPTTSSTWPAS